MAGEAEARGGVRGAALVERRLQLLRVPHEPCRQRGRSALVCDPLAHAELVGLVAGLGAEADGEEVGEDERVPVPRQHRVVRLLVASGETEQLARNVRDVLWVAHVPGRVAPLRRQAAVEQHAVVEALEPRERAAAQPVVADPVAVDQRVHPHAEPPAGARQRVEHLARAVAAERVDDEDAAAE
eukprot:2282921-Prymnesium_polylepis.3